MPGRSCASGFSANGCPAVVQLLRQGPARLRGAQECHSSLPEQCRQYRRRESRQRLCRMPLPPMPSAQMPLPATASRISRPLCRARPAIGRFQRDRSGYDGRQRYFQAVRFPSSEHETLSAAQLLPKLQRVNVRPCALERHRARQITAPAHQFPGRALSALFSPFRIIDARIYSVVNQLDCCAIDQATAPSVLGTPSAVRHKDELSWRDSLISLLFHGENSGRIVQRRF